MENFIDIKGFEGYYEISNLGNVRSKERTVICSNGDLKPIKSRILSPGNNGSGYLFVQLWLGNHSTRKYVHRLVAENFIPNPNNLLEINHIDGNRSNNCVNNLEWCNRLYNERQKEKHISGFKPIKINQINLEGKIINIFDSINSCCRELNISCTKLYSALKKNTVIKINNCIYRFEYNDKNNMRAKSKKINKNKLRNVKLTIKII